MKNHNEGFSLVEFIVVIAILAIFTGVGISAFSYVGLANASKCSYKIDSGLTKLKSYNMSDADKTYMYIMHKNNGYYLAYSTNPSSPPSLSKAEHIGNGSLLIKYDGTNILEGSSLEYVKIGINKKDGSFVYTSNPITKITILGKSDYLITMVQSTGKHVREQVNVDI